MRGWRWLVAIVLVAFCVPLVGCSAPTTAPTKPPDNEQKPPKKPTGEIG